MIFSYVNFVRPVKRPASFVILHMNSMEWVNNDNFKKSSSYKLLVKTICKKVT